MKKALYWMVMNLGFAALVYAGFVVGVDGAQYIVKLFVWAFYLPLGLLCLTDAFQLRLAEEPPHRVRTAAGICLAWVALFVFVWQGHIATGVAWSIWIVCAAIARSGAKLYREQASAVPSLA